MKVLRSSIIAASLLAVAAPAVAQQGRETSIDYAGRGGIRDWHAENDRQLYVRDAANRWYYIQFSGPCPGLLTGDKIAFEADVTGRFDRLSRVVTQTETCGVETVQRSQAPAAKGGKANNPS